MVFCLEYNLDQGNDQEHLKNPWGSHDISSKLHFKCLLCAKIVTFMLQTKTFTTNFSGNIGFLTNKIYRFSELISTNNMCKSWEILRWSLHQPAWFLQKMALKLFAKDANDLEGWLQTVKKFSYDIGMSFGLDKLTGVISVELHWNTVIKDLKQEEVQISWRWWK